ncbi:hypothetical protein HmCmsJML141_02124 [Escherichia coli]|nr:hypothetical protein HmCmsJML141_02124 [Escherichia coli]
MILLLRYLGLNLLMKNSFIFTMQLKAKNIIVRVAMSN